MQRVRLLDELGERFGAEHKFYNLRTPADAIKLLCINYPEFQQHLVTSHEKGIGYRLIQADLDLGYNDLHLPLGQHDLVLVPVITGSGRGVGQILIGVGLVALSLVSFGAGTAFAGAFAKGAWASSALFGIGASLALGGVSQLLSPQPTFPVLGADRFGSNNTNHTNASTSGPQNVIRGTNGQRSYAYTGAINSAGVGSIVPVVYGKALVGGTLLSADIRVTDNSDPLMASIKQSSLENIRIGGEIPSWDWITIQGVDTRRVDRYQVSGPNAYNYNDTIGLNRGDYVEKTPNKNNNQRTHFVVGLGLPDGIDKYVSGPGSTLIDGYITYRIQVFRENKDDLLGAVQGTVQGLVNYAGGSFFWEHRLTHAATDETEIRVRVEVIDSDVNQTSPFRFNLEYLAYGVD